MSDDVALAAEEAAGGSTHTITIGEATFAAPIPIPAMWVFDLLRNPSELGWLIFLERCVSDGLDETSGKDGTSAASRERDRLHATLREQRCSIDEVQAIVREVVERGAGRPTRGAPPSPASSGRNGASSKRGSRIAASRSGG